MTCVWKRHRSGRPRDVDDVSLQFLADARLADRLFQRKHVRRRDARLKRLDGMAGGGLLRRENRRFFVRRHVAESELQGEPIFDLVKGTVASIKAFAGTAPQSDDITLMAIEYRGRPSVS